MSERKQPKTAPAALSPKGDKAKPAPKPKHRPISENPGAALALVTRARRR